MTLRNRMVLAAAVSLVAGLKIPIGNAQQISGPIKAVQLTGLTGVKDNAKGALNVENDHLHFIHGKTSSDVSASAIQDVVTGADSEQAVGKTVGIVSMAAPYGGGRFLSLFRKKIDTLTVQYRDAEGGLHGAIFTMPVGTAEVIKKKLVAQGAHTTASEQTYEATTSTKSSNKEEKQ
jgi:hypothetical protein